VSRDLEADLAYVNSFTQGDDRKSTSATMQFVGSAVTGWPYAIKRAEEAEKEVDRLRNELNMYQEQESRRCWD
jgi:hypothetical protein